MAISARHHGHFGRFDKADWRLWIGAALVGGALMASGLYFLRDDGAAPSITTPPASSVPAPEGAGAAPAVGAPRFSAGVEAAPVVYIVGSAEQRDRLMLGIYEADLIRGADGLRSLGAEMVILDEASAGQFLAAMEESNRVRASEGLPAYSIIDLR